VPASSATLEHVLGPGAAAGLVDGVERRAPEMLAVGRGLFERWLDRVVAAVPDRPRLERTPRPE
jgi:hypothetical protein